MRAQEIEGKASRRRNESKIREASTAEARAVASAREANARLEALARSKAQLERQNIDLQHQVTLMQNKLKKSEGDNSALRARLAQRVSGGRRGISASGACPVAAQAAQGQPSSPRTAAAEGHLEALQLRHESLLSVVADIRGILMEAVQDYAAVRQHAVTTVHQAAVELTADPALAPRPALADEDTVVSFAEEVSRRLETLEASPGGRRGRLPAWPTESQIDALMEDLQSTLDKLQQAIDDLKTVEDPQSGLGAAVAKAVSTARLQQQNAHLAGMVRCSVETLQQQHALLRRLARAPEEGSPHLVRRVHLTPQLRPADVTRAGRGSKLRRALVEAEPPSPGSSEKVLREVMAALSSPVSRLSVSPIKARPSRPSPEPVQPDKRAKPVLQARSTNQGDKPWHKPRLHKSNAIAFNIEF